MLRIHHLAAVVGCLLLVQGDCFANRPGNFSLSTSDLPNYLMSRTCWHFESPHLFGHHECVPNPLPSDDTCATKAEFYFEKSVQAALDAGLRYDGEDCLGRLEQLGGAVTLPSGTWLDCANDCQFFYGDQPEGAACESYGHRMSDCAQGLVCAPDRTCHQPCDFSFTAPQGGFCGPARGMWFVTCDAGLACGVDGTCEPAAALGSACNATTPCAVEGWCDPDTAACVARLAGSSPCTEHEQCVSDLCIDGACVEPQWLECGRWGW